MALSTGDKFSVIGNTFAILGVILGLFVYLWPAPAAPAAIWSCLKSIIKWMANCNARFPTSQVDIELGLGQRDQFPSPTSTMANYSGPNPPPAA